MFDTKEVFVKYRKDVLYSFSIGFLTGFLPSLIFYLSNDIESWFWSFLPALIFGVLVTFGWLLIKNYKIIGSMIFMIALIIFTYYLLLLWRLNKGFIGPFH